MQEKKNCEKEYGCNENCPILKDGKCEDWTDVEDFLQEQKLCKWIVENCSWIHEN